MEDGLGGRRKGNDGGDDWKRGLNNLKKLGQTNISKREEENDEDETTLDRSSNSTMPATLSQCSMSSSIISSSAPRGMSSTMIHRRRGRNHTESPALMRRQLQVLGTTSAVSGVVFLLAFLNIFALSALMVTFLTLYLLLQSIVRYIQLEHEQNPRFFYDILPPNIQSYLTTTTLHEWMMSTEGSPYMEYRYLLLYFIPGLTEPQLNALISRLPRRHRQLLMQPGGIARMLLPDRVTELLSPPDTIFEEYTIQEEEEEDEEVEEPTLQEAIQGIVGTVRHMFPNSQRQQLQLQQSENLLSSPALARNITEQNSNDMVWDGDDSNFIIGSGVADPPPSTVRALLENDDENNNNNDDDASALRHLQIQDEYATEEAILTDALTATMSNYASSVSQYLLESSEFVLEHFTPSIVRGGLGLSAISAIGWMGFRRYSTNLNSNPTINRIIDYSFLATTALGSASAGIAYFARSWVRKSMKNAQKEIEENESDDQKKNQ